MKIYIYYPNAKNPAPIMVIGSVMTYPGNEAEYHLNEYQSDGTITFRAAGKNKVHFECSNVWHNIAEGKSEAGRPAVLEGNVFEYRDVNECHYAFSATFFRRFVVLESLSGGESTGCFGMGASFDGVYVKVKN